jgi:hypothetical protein
VVKNVFHHPDVIIRQFYVSPGHRPFHGFNGFIEKVNGCILGIHPAEGWDQLRRVTVAEQVAAYPAVGAGIEHGIDACLAVITHHRAQELLPGILVFPGMPVGKFDSAVVVFQVRCVCVGAEVAPLTEQGIAGIPVVGFVLV